MRRQNARAERRSPLRGQRNVAVVVGTAFVAALFAVALVFSNAAGASRVAENARALHWTNGAASSAAIARAAVSQAVIFGIDYALDVADVEARDVAIVEAEANIEELAGWITRLDPDLVPDSDAIRESLADLLEAGRATIASVTAGEVAEADRQFQEDLEAAYTVAADGLAARQAQAAARIADTEDLAGLIGTLSGLVVTLLIPIVALGVYFGLARRQYREATVKMEAQVQAERDLNRAKDEFIAGISHELRTPLTSIYGFSEYILENGVQDVGEAHELITLINSDSAELARMVEDLLIAARLDSGQLRLEMEPVPVRDTIEDVLGPLYRTRAPIEVTGQDAVVWADRARVLQLLRNLLSNAVRHGGESITVGLETRDGSVVITVADDGDGVRSEVGDRMFDRFVHDGSGALLTGSVGLGLAIARALARLMGGEVDYVRALGWTSFLVTLPLATAEQRDGDHGESSSPSVVEPALLTLETVPQSRNEEGLAMIQALSSAVRGRSRNGSDRIRIVEF